MNIYVSNLSFNVTDDDLQGFFSDYGAVSSAKVITDKFTGKSRGFGFVEMADDEAAKKAISELDGGVVEGRSIKVTEARPREERSGGGGGNDRRSFSRNNSYNNRY
jgi:RNA recognition motif-containing protein